MTFVLVFSSTVKTADSRLFRVTLLSLSGLHCQHNSMEMGPPTSEEADKTTSILHASKSESNLCSFNTASSSLSNATSMQTMANENLEDMVTSTPAPNNDDHDFQTPRRGIIFSRSSGSSSNGRRHKLVRTSSEISSRTTPSSGPRINPFDSHLSVDRLHLPTCSPSVFSIVVSPSQEAASGSGSKFWSLDQQARLFPAQISDDSPWKQESALSRLDQEDKTQEAIDYYFKRNHNITTPEDVPVMTVKSFQERSRLMDNVGNSPNLTANTETNNDEEKGNAGKNNSNASSNVSYEQSQQCRSTQTCLTLPPILPPEVESVLAKYGLKDEKEDVGIRILAPSGVLWGTRRVSGEGVSNISNSTLRRKLFAGMIPDDEDILDSDEENTNDDDIDMKALGANKENCESTAMMISPGKIMMTPNAQRIPSPNKSVSQYFFIPKFYVKLICLLFQLSWSLSPVSRNKRPNSRTTPLGSSTPSKS